ncbi:Cadmium efflux system accessory protein, partial [human gut metagenome]
MKEENTNIDNCSCNVIHENVVEMVKNALPQDEVLYDLAELFKAFILLLCFYTQLYF